MMQAAMEAGLAGFLGLLFGSFATLAVWRLPRGEKIVATRSRCPSCGRQLGPRDLVPVLSWTLARGRCRCGARIPARYPLTELAVAAIFVAAWAAAGLTPAGALLALLGLALFIASWIDFETLILPDETLATGAVLGIGWVWLGAGPGWIDAIAGAALAACAAWLLRALFTRWKGQEALGLGDVKLMALGGLWLGLAGLAPMFILAGLLGVATGLYWRFRHLGARFPFGPALALALWLLALARAAGLPPQII